jgi:hypothetical protein
VKASFVPPPIYDPSPTSSPASSPRPSIDALPPLYPQYANHPLPPQSPSRLSPYSASGFGFPPRSPSSTNLAPDSPAIEFIRETLYDSVADALERQPSLRALLKRDPPRAYFASVAYAILDNDVGAEYVHCWRKVLDMHRGGGITRRAVGVWRGGLWHLRTGLMCRVLGSRG